MNIAEIRVCDAIHFTGDLRPGRFRNIGVVTGVYTQRGLGGEVYVQRLSTMGYYILKHDAAGRIIQSDVPWDESDGDDVATFGAPVAALDDETCDTIDDLMREKGFEPFAREYVHPATVRLLERLRKMNFLAD